MNSPESAQNSVEQALDLPVGQPIVAAVAFSSGMGFKECGNEDVTC